MARTGALLLAAALAAPGVTATTVPYQLGGLGGDGSGTPFTPASAAGQVQTSAGLYAVSWGYLEVTNSARGNDYCLTSEPPSSVDPQLAFVQTTTCNYNVSVPTMAAGTTNAQVVYAMSDGSFYSANALNGAGGCLASSFNNGALINQYAASGGSHLLFKQCDGSLNQKYVWTGGRIQHYLSGQCLDINNAKHPGTTVILLPCNNLTSATGNDQWWRGNTQSAITAPSPIATIYPGPASPSTNLWLPAPPPPPSSPPPSSPPPSGNSAPPPPPGAQDALFLTPGTTSYTVPPSAAVSSVSIVCVGAGGSGAYTARRTKNLEYSGGGGGGGALSYVIGIPVVPGVTTFSVTVGAPGTTCTTPNGAYFLDLPSYGQAGGDSFVTLNGINVVYAGGGGAGLQTQTPPTCGTSGTGALGGCGGCPVATNYNGIASVGFCGGNGGIVNATVSDYGYGPGGGGAGGYAGPGGNGGWAGDGDYVAANLAVCAGGAVPFGTSYPGICAPGGVGGGAYGQNGAGGGGGGAGGCYATQTLYDCSGAPGGGVGLWGIGTNGLGSPAFGMYQGSNETLGYAPQGALPGGPGSCPFGSCPWGAGGGGYIYDGVDLSLESADDPFSQGYGGTGACRIVLGNNPPLVAVTTVVSTSSKSNNVALGVGLGIGLGGGLIVICLIAIAVTRRRSYQAGQQSAVMMTPVPAGAQA